MTSPEILIPDSLDSRLHQMSIILSTSQKEEVQKLQPVVILESAQMAPSTSALSSNLLKLLIGQGFSVVKSTLATMPEPADTFFISLIDIDAPLLDHLCEEEFSSLRTLTTKSAGVLWMTHGGLKSGDSLPSHASLVGLFRTIRAEAPHLRLFTLDLSSTIDLCSKVPSDLILRLFNTSFSAQDDPVVDYEYAESDGKLFIPRLVQDETMNTSLVNRTELPTPEMAPLFQPGRPLKMVVGELGLLDTMRFVDRPEMQGPLPADCIDVQILATGLNFVDIMAALGYIPSPSLGAEYSGVVTAVGSAVPEEECHVGQIVVGSAECCIASNVRVHWKMVNEVPKGIAPEAAATCLIAYSTAYFALYDNGRLKPTDTILIHYAAGGLGQAAIQLAQHIGATIYCTVGSLEKKNLIMQQYGIPENQIFNSRDMTFKQGIMRETKGRGVDVILNSTFGEMLRETWNCLADHGIMVEVGKRDILSNNSLEMAPFIRGCTFSALNLAQYTEDSEPHRLRNYQAVVKKVFKLLGDGVITTPYPLQVMDVTEAEEAFRALQSGRFSGKTVLMMNQSAIVPVLPKKKEPLELDPDATYLLAGGLGGIGRSLSNLLENHGAKHIAFVSRSGDANDEASITLEKLHEKGVNAVAYKCDITDRDALEAVLQKCTAEMPPIKGFVNCAMLLKVSFFPQLWTRTNRSQDTIFENMTHSDWVAATGPKIQGSWNMHEILPANLDFFIMLSSTSGIIGNPGQANYAAGNTFQNGLAHHRRRKGLKATSIDLSAVTGIGYLAENSAAYEQRKTLLKMTIKEDEIHHIFLAAIEGVIKGDQEMPPQMTTGIIGGEVLRSLMPVAPWANDSKFILLRKADGLSGSSARGDTALKDAFLVSESIAEAAVIVEMALTARLAKALFINSEDIDIAKPLHSYGGMCFSTLPICESSLC
jgi:NADPH:quinone reductase-like Zn-dependent oxidoreductase